VLPFSHHHTPSFSLQHFREGHAVWRAAMFSHKAKYNHCPNGPFGLVLAWQEAWGPCKGAEETMKAPPWNWGSKSVA
jgi:hypothetical protein